MAFVAVHGASLRLPMRNPLTSGKPGPPRSGPTRRLLPLTICAAGHEPQAIPRAPTWQPVTDETLLDDLLHTRIQWNNAGLVPAVAQQFDSSEVLMMAWMNAAALRETLATGRVCYYSRSRKALWRKGESSGQVQRLVELRVDCDGDTLLVKVDQVGVACHTGRRSCFYLGLGEDGVRSVLDVQIDPSELYGK